MTVKFYGLSIECHAARLNVSWFSPFVSRRGMACRMYWTMTCDEGSACWQCHFYYSVNCHSFIFSFPACMRYLCRTLLACLLISGEVGKRLIHLVGDCFVFTALVYQHVCNEKGGNVVLVDGTMVSQVYILIFLIGKRKRHTHIQHNNVLRFAARL